MDIGAYHFQNPEAFWLFILVPILVALYIYRQQRRKSTIKFPALSIAKKAVPSRRVRLRHIVPALRLAALCCFIVALARPQNAMEVEYTNTDGVDIMLALDVSGSMGTLDMLTRVEQAKLGVMNAERILKSGDYWKYSRMGYAQVVIAEFIQKRHSDRIGLSAFGSRAVTQCPLTLDYGSLLEILGASDELARDSIIAGRTAIGDGLMNALARLQKSEAKSKVVILLTDGKDNASVISPVRAAEVAQSLGIKVYTVGVGSLRGQPIPKDGALMKDSEGNIVVSRLDETTLRRIAEVGGGAYVHAGSEEFGLGPIVDDIKKMEAEKYSSIVFEEYDEQFMYFLGAALVLLAIEMLIGERKHKRRLFE